MSQSRSTATYIGVVAIAALTLLVALTPFSRPTVDPPPPLYKGPIVATVDEQPIFLTQALFRAQGVQTSHQTETLGKEGRSPWPAIILQSLADDVIIRREAELAGVSVSATTTAAAVARTLGALGGSDRATNYLESQGITLPQFASRVYMQLLGAALYLEVTKDVTVSDSDIKAAFRKSEDQFPGENREIAYAQAYDSIKEFLVKEANDVAYQEWLKAQEERPEYAIDVRDPNWWHSVVEDERSIQEDQGGQP